MGNCFCEAESPCGSLEERHGLLKDDSKTSSTGDRIEVGACGPEDGEDMRRAVCEQPKKVGSGEQMRRSKDGEPNNTQGNGHLRKDSSPGKESATGAQEVEKNDATADPCTLNQLREDSSTPVSQEALAADGEEKKAEEKDDPTTAQEKASDLVSPESIPPPPEIDSTTEDDMASGSHAGSGEDAIVAEAKPSEAFTQNDEESSEPSAQEATTSAVSRETNTEAPSCSADSDADIESHVISQPPSSGSEPSGVGHAREKADSVGSAAEAKDSSTPDQEETTENGGSSPAEDTAGEAGKNVTEEDEVKFEEDKENDREKVEGALTETLAAQVEAEIQEETREEENAVLKGDDKPAAEEEDAPHDSEEDLYQGEEELAPSQKHQPQPTSELEISKVQDSCSLSPAVDILSYSEKEWKGNTAKSALIRKGYKEMSEKFSHLRRVRGDNYCALRATLFQVLSQSDQVPQWLQEEAVLMLPKILQDQDGLISHWQFPGLQTQGEGTEDPAERLKGYVEMLRKTWQAAADCPSAAERQKLCERLFQGEEEELGMLEALKLLMLGRAAELHRLMQVGEDVPLFCWLLFARDSSGCPRSFLSNHLRHVGIGAGLEQVEMFLLGYALQRTIQVYRLYKADTEEFVTFYPDDHRDDWPSVCLVTEDDRHYNVPVADAAEPSKELAGS